MACQINRSQLQKQSSVDHEDDSDAVNELSKLQINAHESQNIVEENKNAFPSELYDEYYSLKSKVDLMHEKNSKSPVTDDLKEPMLNFIIRTLSSDKPADCQHLQDCYRFLNTSIFSQTLNQSEGDSKSEDMQLSVEWENQESRARMIMHKLCAFFGLHHNIIGQQYSSTIKIDFDSTNFIDWGCTIEELSRYLELKRDLNINDQEDSSPEAKTILKRSSSSRQQSFNASHNNDSRSNNKTYEDRHNRYYQLRKQLGLPHGENVDDLSIKKSQKTVKQMHSMPTHDSSSKDQLIRVKMEAQQRSATTDYEHESNYIDSSLSNSDFMSGDSVVLFQDSTSGISSPSEVIPVMMQYPLSDDTLVYKLVPSKLSTLSVDDNAYILPPGTNHPSLLINNDGKPFRYKAGTPLVGFWVQSIPLYMSNSNALPEEKMEPKECKGDSANYSFTSTGNDIKQSNNNNCMTLPRALAPPLDSANLGNNFGPSGCSIQAANLIPMPIGDNMCHGYPPPNGSNFPSLPQQYSRSLVASASQPPQVPTPPINPQSISAIQYFPQISGSEYVPVPINSANIPTNHHNPAMQICAPHAPSLLSTQHNLQTYFPPGVMPYQTIMLPPPYLLPSQTPSSLPRYIQPQGYVSQLPMQSSSPVISQAHQQFPFQNIPSAVSYAHNGQFLMQHSNYVAQGRVNQLRNSRPNRQSNITSNNVDESQ